jgi:hypothetical protein
MSDVVEKVAALRIVPVLTASDPDEAERACHDVALVGSAGACCRERSASRFGRSPVGNISARRFA